MGRYDGEERDYGPRCRPSQHQFPMNGICRACGASRSELVEEAKVVLELAEQGKLGRYAG